MLLTICTETFPAFNNSKSIFQADLLPSPSFAVRLKKREEYPVIWAACELERMNFGGKLGECSGWAYIVKKKANVRRFLLFCS